MKFNLLFLIIVLPFTLLSQIPRSARSDKAVKNCSMRLTKELQNSNLTIGSPVFIRIFKESNELELWVKRDSKFSLFKKYEICYYSGDLGPKTKQGDRQSPEGFYTITPGQLNPASSYHLSFNIGYPNTYEQKKGYTGSAIMVHGNCVSIGCFAMTDSVIEEIWAIIYKAFENNQKSISLQIFPFRMSMENLSKNKNNKWYSFWMNLKEGYDFFETSKVPPVVKVKDNKYCFSKALD